jgi:8-oxo-dGTP pyrophosphatase MutT (NUDIX family)
MIKEKKVVSCFIEHRGRLLLLKRSARVGTYRGKWATVSGYLEKPPDEQALVEIKEELGLLNRDVKLIKRGQPLEIEDRELMIKWLVYPYLFSLKDGRKINTDWEHREFKWVLPGEIINYDTVPGLNEALARVYPV